MIYKIECSCGHVEKFNLYGKKEKRDWIAEKKEYELCSECKKQEFLDKFEKEKLEAANKAKELELPMLEGTEKQIAWAETIRQKWIGFIENKIIYVAKDIETYILEDEEKSYYNYKKADNTELITLLVERFISAKYYIDNRDNFNDVKKELYKLKIKYKDIDKVKIEKEMEKIIENELTIRPEICKYKESVKIITDKENMIIKVKFSKNDDFYSIIKNEQYEWNGSLWNRKIYWHSGNIEDRAIELGNKFLNEGFAITMDSKELLDKAAKGEYEQEKMRIIFVQKDSDKLAIWNKERNDKIYKAAKTIKSSIWKSPNILVKVNYYEEVLDFAELYNFEVRDSAKNMIKKYKEELSNIKTVSPTKIKKEILDDNKLEKILKSSDEILPDLIDD